MHRALAEAIDLFAQAVANSSRPEDRAVAGGCLASLAPLLASAVLGRGILRDLDGIEHMLGNARFVDAALFEPALKKWSEFRDEYEHFVLSGMTVHERIAALALGGAFETATAANDVAGIQRILRRARVDEASIAAIVARR